MRFLINKLPCTLRSLFSPSKYDRCSIVMSRMGNSNTLLYSRPFAATDSIRALFCTQTQIHSTWCSNVEQFWVSAVSCNAHTKLSFYTCVPKNMQIKPLLMCFTLFTFYANQQQNTSRCLWMWIARSELQRLQTLFIKIQSLMLYKCFFDIKSELSIPN